MLPIFFNQKQKKRTIEKRKGKQKNWDVRDFWIYHILCFLSIRVKIFLLMMQFPSCHISWLTLFFTLDKLPPSHFYHVLCDSHHMLCVCPCIAPTLLSFVYSTYKFPSNLNDEWWCGWKMHVCALTMCNEEVNLTLCSIE